MKATIYGSITRPVVAVVGTWDPLLSIHQQLFEEMSSYAKQSSLSALAIVIDPAPQTFMFGPYEFPVYNDVYTRMHLISTWLDGVLHLHFIEDDLSAGATEFFDVVLSQVKVDELWLGATQSLGRGVPGNAETIAELCLRYRIRLKRLPLPTAASSASHDAQRLLQLGRVAEASKAVGRTPMMSRQPESGKLRLPWPKGLYRGVALDNPTVKVEGLPKPVELVTQSRGFPALCWPDPKIKYLAFVSGPGDHKGTIS